MRLRTIFLSASALAAALPLWTNTALAQDGSSIQLEEVIVTARKRKESLQDVPIAVTAINANAIEFAFVTTVTDLEKLIPNIDLADNPFAGQALGATIRGIGFSDLEKSFEPAVGFSIDGVFLASNTGAAIDAFDLEQVEVLRGPQGTLFGRNTVGGVINVTRSRPTGTAGFRAKTRQSNYGGQEYMLVANTPKLGNVLSSKFYVFDRELDTFATNIITQDEDDQTDITSYGAAFLIEPNDRFEALISVDVFDDDSQGPPTYNLTQPGEVFCDTPNFLASMGVFAPSTIDAGCSSRSFDIAEASDFEIYTRAVPFITVLDGTSVTANLEYEISDSLTLTSITGYRETDEQLLEENLGGPNLEVDVAPGVRIGFPILYQNRVQESEQFSQEIRLSGILNDDISFVSGIYFLEAEYELTGGLYPDGSFGISQAFGAVSTDERYKQNTSAYAIFADGTYDLAENWKLSAGLRYSRETKDAEKDFILSSVPGVSGTSVSTSESWNAWTGRLTLQRDLRENAMVYGGWSRGFRSGGFNGRAASATAIGPYDPETVDSFEIGLRSTFLDNRLRFNPTIFYAQYDDKQEENLIAVPGGGPGATETTVQNASVVDTKGLEIELLAQVTPLLTVRSAIGITDAEFSQFLAPEDPADPSNTNTIDVRDSRNLRAGPDSTFSFGVTYVRPLMNGASQLTFDASHYWADELVTSAASDPLGLGRDIVGSNSATDFAIKYETLRSEGFNFSVTAYINDAFDDGPGRLGNSIVIPGLFTFGTGAPTQAYGMEFTVEY